jgi:urease beta subunit
MIPGEVVVQEGEIELNAGRTTSAVTSGEYRRSPNSSRFSFSFLRGK